MLLGGMDANENPSLDVTMNHIEGGLMTRRWNFDGNLFISNKSMSQLNPADFENYHSKRELKDTPAILARNAMNVRPATIA